MVEYDKMFRRYIFIATFLLSIPSFADGTGGVIRCAADLSRAIYTPTPSAATTTDFDITATVSAPNHPDNPFLCIRDASGECRVQLVSVAKTKVYQAGEVLHLRGHTRYEPKNDNIFADADRIEHLAYGSPPKPTDTTIAQILSCELKDYLVRVKGIVTDAFCDEIDPKFIFFILADGSDTISLSLMTDGSAIDFSRYVGATVEACGTCSFSKTRSRAKVEAEVGLHALTDLTIVKPPPSDPFDVPPLRGTIHDIQNQRFGPMRRSKTRGRVTAVWQSRCLLIESDTGEISKVELANDKPPRYGDFVETVGIVETDLYHLNLSRASWRPSTPFAATNQPPEDVTADFMLTDGKGHQEFKVRYHGKPIRMTGLVRHLPAAGNGEGRINLECGDYLVPVDFGSVPCALNGVESGCQVEVSGTCVMDIENWRPQTPFPHIRGFSIVLRTPADIRILARPPWWTPRRLLSVIGLLALALGAVIVRNRILKRIAETKLKERTRLAVELHDAVSQNLTAVALEVNAADALAGEDLVEARSHLRLAAKTLKSCREELRYCLWDLRNDALEESDMTEAIRRTLSPQVGGTDLSVRFNVPRSRFTDNTAHAVLHIIRELAVNAVRHGNATAIRIAGSLDGDQLLFSVRDNGTGFDPAAAPGIEQGHFGLQGIRERVKGFAGRLDVESAIGKGTRVSVAITLPQKEEESK